jgi:DNA-binding ferritin-like protein (Dps family)
MNFWETVTGSDLTREWKVFEARAEALPADYRAAWEQIKLHLSPYSGFTGRNLMPILDGALGLLEETAADGQTVDEVLGDDVEGFCVALAGGKGGSELSRPVARAVEPERRKEIGPARGLTWASKTSSRARSSGEHTWRG